VENVGGLGRHLAGRLAAAGESVVEDVPPKLSARVRVLSSGNARKNDELDALATAVAASHNERLERVMNSAGKPHPDADSTVSSVHRRSPVFRIRKPFLSKFITASRHFGE
jgi:hypothetical protein